MVFTTSSIAASVALVASASAHMMMTNPVPYSPNELVYDPINPALNQFPCASGKDRYEIFQDNAVTAGTNLPVTFDGSVVHGSGVCQFSVTYDFPPSEDPSKWKVIHTILGGCPAEAEANLPDTGVTNEFGKPTGNQCGDSTGTECVRQFDIPIPAELPNGQATFGWTWLNEIGNREMYMNCAPLTISGGAEDNTFLDALPQVWIANAGAVNGQPGCTAPDGSYIYDIPAANRGSSVVENQTPNSPAFADAACGAQGVLAKREVSHPHARQVAKAL